MDFFSHFPMANIDIISPNGELRCSTKAILTEDDAQIPDVNIDIEPGDEIRRLLPNGKEEVYIVRNATFQDAFHGIKAHYGVKISRKGSFPRHTGGHYIHVTGNNARVNLHSSDHSTNIANSGSVFAELKTAIQEGVANPAERQALIRATEAMQAAGDPTAKALAYQQLIACAANHMTILTPFLPALAQALT